MSTQLLIYENVVPLSKERHAKCSVEVRAEYNYTQNLNSLPLLAAEFMQTAREFPIVFRVAENAIQPVAILVVGLLVLFIVLSMLLPIFQLNSIIG